MCKFYNNKKKISAKTENKNTYVKKKKDKKS